MTAQGQTRPSHPTPVSTFVRCWSASSTGRRNTLSLREKIDYRPISQRFRGGTRATEKIALWDSWLRRGSLKAIGRAFGKPSSLFIASWPPMLRRPVEITVISGQTVPRPKSFVVRFGPKADKLLRRSDCPLCASNRQVAVLQNAL